MGLKVFINDSGEQEYGVYSYNTEYGILRKHSKRKDYPDTLCTGRREVCIIDAITNYNKDLDNRIKKIREEYK